MGTSSSINIGRGRSSRTHTLAWMHDFMSTRDTRSAHTRSEMRSLQRERAASDSYIKRVCVWERVSAVAYILRGFWWRLWRRSSPSSLSSTTCVGVGQRALKLEPIWNGTIIYSPKLQMLEWNFTFVLKLMKFLGSIHDSWTSYSLMQQWKIWKPNIL